jgi:hypothetical protein
MFLLFLLFLQEIRLKEKTKGILGLSGGSGLGGGQR